MEIFLVRHGIAEDHAASGRDSDRSLTQAGSVKAREVAKQFHKVENSLCHIFHSPLLRAVQTAEIFSSIYNIEMRGMAGLRPEDSPSVAVNEIRKLDYEKIMLVGHEPNLSHLAAILLGASLPFFSFKKAGIAGINWNGRVGELVFLLAPRFLV